MLTVVVEAVDCINQSIEDLYSADVWLEQAVAQRIAQRGPRFVELYGQLAQMAFHEGLALWALMPKGHVVHHTFLGGSSGMDYQSTGVCGPDVGRFCGRRALQGV